MSHILVVDDDKAYADMLVDVLQAEGHVAESVRDVGQLAARLDAGGFDAAILDMQMPLGGGMAGVKLIRAKFANVVIPVIVCSGMPIEKVQEWFQGIPKLAVFQKPPDVRAMLDELARLLNQP